MPGRNQPDHPIASVEPWRTTCRPSPVHNPCPIVADDDVGVVQVGMQESVTGEVVEIGRIGVCLETLLRASEGDGWAGKLTDPRQEIHDVSEVR